MNVMNNLMSKFTKFQCPNCEAPISFAEAERTITIPWFLNFRRNSIHVCSRCSNRLKLFSRLPSWILFLSIWILLGIQAAGSFGIMLGVLPFIKGSGSGLALIFSHLVQRYFRQYFFCFGRGRRV